MAIIDTAKANAKTTIALGTILTFCSMFGVFYKFDNIYARETQLERVESSVLSRVDSIETLTDGKITLAEGSFNKRLDTWQIQDLEDKIFVIDMKENPTRTDKALRKRYQQRLDALRATG